jgi:type IV pilus assembly protein PilQ
LNIPVISLPEALRLVARYAHMEVVVSPEVQGVASLHVTHIEPAAVLDSLLLTHDLAKSAAGNVWYIAPRAQLIKAAEEQASWQTHAEQSENLSARVWKVRYAKAKEIAAMFTGGAGMLSERGEMQADARTNIIFARDTRERLAIIDQIIMRLDVPVQQIMIEARLVSVDQDAERLLGVEFAINSADNDKLQSISGMVHEAAGRYSVAVAHLPDGSQLDIKLAALEQAGRANLISSPSLFTGSDQEASIEAGEEVPYQEVSESGGTAVAFKKAVLGLKVTPQILPGNTVLLALKINQDRPSARMVQGVPAISTRQILTNVQVKNGQTIVLGGIYEINHEDNQKGLPFLGKLPVIGLLFREQGKREQKRELLIFVTPKIMPQAK